jgi:hypothetical protein
VKAAKRHINAHAAAQQRGVADYPYKDTPRQAESDSKKVRCMLNPWEFISALIEMISGEDPYLHMPQGL